MTFSMNYLKDSSIGKKVFNEQQVMTENRMQVVDVDWSNKSHSLFFSFYVHQDKLAINPGVP